MKKLICLLLFSSSAFAALMTGPSENVLREHPFVMGDKVLIENISGKITVTAIVEPKVYITATKRKAAGVCEFYSEKTEYDELHIRVERKGKEECDIDLEIRAPKESNLAIWSSSGDVKVSGFEGNLAFNVGSAAVVADGKFKKIDGNSGSGDVTINGVNGGGNITAGSGTVNMRFLDSPKGALNLKVGSGDTQLNFLKGNRIRADLKSGSGEVVNDLNSYESADFGLNIQSGSGDVKVKSYE